MANPSHKMPFILVSQYIVDYGQEFPCRLILQNHRITESQNGRGWKGPLWVI